MGEGWERRIRSVKAGLVVVLKSRRMKEELLLTLMAEVADIVNSRPLTDVSVDPNDPRPISPKDFLRVTFPNGVTWGPNSINVRKLWWRVHEVAQYFWSRWLREYLPSLTNRKKWIDATKPLAVGDW